MEDSIPEALLKYLRAEHAQSMAREGRVRIGTLFDFRSMEREDSQRRDGGEGRLVLHSDDGRRSYNSTEELPPVLRRMSISCGRGGIVTEGENAVVFDVGGPDIFIYCVSERLDDAMRGQLGGACVRIDDPSRFFDAVDAALRLRLAAQGRSLGRMTLGRCRYEDRRHNWHDKLPPQWLLKPPGFAYQHEWRAAWAVEDNGQLKPLLVSSPEIAVACTIVC